MKIIQRGATLLIGSTLDAASVNIVENLVKTIEWTQMSSNVWMQNNIFLWFQNRPLVHLNYANNLFCEANPEITIPHGLNDVIFLSRHSASSGTASLTVHPIGIPSQLENDRSGGVPGRCSPPHFRIGSIYRNLLKETKSSGLDTQFQVTMEATHHGPYVKLPTCFVEIGSSEEHWSLETAGGVWSRVLSRELGLVLREEYRIECTTPSSYHTIPSPLSSSFPPLIGVMLIGGGHYVPRLNDTARLSVPSTLPIPLPVPSLDLNLVPALVPGASSIQSHQTGVDRELENEEKKESNRLNSNDEGKKEEIKEEEQTNQPSPVQTSTVQSNTVCVDLSPYVGHALASYTFKESLTQEWEQKEKKKEKEKENKKEEEEPIIESQRKNQVLLLVEVGVQEGSEIVHPSPSTISISSSSSSSEDLSLPPPPSPLVPWRDVIREGLHSTRQGLQGMDIVCLIDKGTFSASESEMKDMLCDFLSKDLGVPWTLKSTDIKNMLIERFGEKQRIEESISKKKNSKVKVGK